METKLCLRCTRDLLVAEFSRHKGRPDGLQAYCKTCTRAANAASLTKNRDRANVETPASKRCARCGVTRPAADFYRDRRRRDGLYANCKFCHGKVTTGWKKRNPDAVRAIARRAYGKNAEQRRASARATYWGDVERAHARYRRWKSANRAHATALEAIRRAQKRNAPGTATPHQIAARVAYYGGKCWICRTAPWEHIDHVKPLAAGGSNWPANLRPACASCNSQKRDTWPFAA